MPGFLLIVVNPVILRPVFTGRAVLFLLKYPIKGGYAGKTVLQCNLRNGELGLRQESFRSLDSPEGNIIPEGETCILLKTS